MNDMLGRSDIKCWRDDSTTGRAGAQLLTSTRQLGRSGSLEDGTSAKHIIHAVGPVYSHYQPQQSRELL
ncbi:MAG: hypothetical protein AAGD43_22710, partial [Pseudomonadota bacterium]